MKRAAQFRGFDRLQSFRRPPYAKRSTEGFGIVNLVNLTGAENLFIEQNSPVRMQMNQLQIMRNHQDRHVVIVPEL